VHTSHLYRHGHSNEQLTTFYDAKDIYCKSDMRKDDLLLSTC
jgi:hypothetical protein